MKKIIETPNKITLADVTKDDFKPIFFAWFSGKVWKVFDMKHREHILEFGSREEVTEFMKRKDQPN